MKNTKKCFHFAHNLADFSARTYKYFIIILLKNPLKFFGKNQSGIIIQVEPPFEINFICVF